MQNIKDGWLIPVAIIFALSFPPLFGNGELLSTSAVLRLRNRYDPGGSSLGTRQGIRHCGGRDDPWRDSELLVSKYPRMRSSDSVFKYWCRGRALRESKKNLNYACLSQALQEGGFVMATIVRLSVIPT